MNNEEHVYIRYISHFILERGTQFVVSLRDRWRDIYLERGLLLVPYLLPGARGCQHLHPLASCIVRDVRDASDRLPIPSSTPDSLDSLSKSDRVVLISCGLLPVAHLLNRPALTHYHPTTWQLVKAHAVTRNEPKIHVICYIIIKRQLCTACWEVFLTRCILKLTTQPNYKCLYAQSALGLSVWEGMNLSFSWPPPALGKQLGWI